MKKVLNKVKNNYLFVFILSGLILGNIGIYGANEYNSNSIEYNPTDSNWKVSNINEAINSLYSMKTELDNLNSLGDATASDITKGKTAVVNGKLITGTSSNSINQLIPNMTSNTEPYGIVSASYVYFDRDSYWAFNGKDPDPTTGYNYWYTNVKNSYLQYEFRSIVNIQMYSFLAKITTGYDNTNVLVQTSLDGKEWVNINTYTIYGYSYLQNKLEKINNIKAKYIRFTNLGSELAIGLIHVFGTEE